MTTPQAPVRRWLVKGSVKRTVMIWSYVALIVVCLDVGHASAKAIRKDGDLGSGAVMALSAALAALAGGSNWAYRKKGEDRDGGVQG